MDTNKNTITLSKEHRDYIKKLIKIAKILKIEKLIIDELGARGDFVQDGILLSHAIDPIKFDFQSIALTRIDTLYSRLNVLSEDYNIEIEEKPINDTTKIVTKLKIVGKKSDLDFKCANPVLLDKVMRGIKDPVYYNFDIDFDSIGVITKAQSTIGEAGNNKTLTFIGKGNKVTCKLTDADGDTFNHVVSESLTKTAECDQEKFVFAYKHKTLVPILKEAMETDRLNVNVTKRGFMIIMIGPFKIWITPEI